VHVDGDEYVDALVESRKVKRVCRSINTAEVLSLEGDRDSALWIQQLCLEQTGDLFVIRLAMDC
jgi:hypothetical protein